jgi:hypothetical protein
MPNPPDQPTGQVTAPQVKEQAPAPETAGGEQTTALEAPLPLNADMAKILEEKVDIIAQRLVYHSQMMVGVSAVGADPVSARNATLAIAEALRSEQPDRVIHALTNLGDPQVAQINDHTLPYRYNAQVAGLYEGLLLDTFAQAYHDNPERKSDSRAMLEKLFIEANEQAQGQPKQQLAFQAPGPSPNARK